jgi:predicted DNA-binding transcriptional regulator AlpA
MRRAVQRATKSPRELHRILNVTQFGEQIIAERLSDAVLKRTAVMAITSLTSAAMTRQMAAGKFPAPVAIGEAARGWLLSEVEKWIAARKAERDAAERAQNDAVAQAMLDAMARERRDPEPADLATSKQNTRRGKAAAIGGYNVQG